MPKNLYDIIIIGSGPSGLTAAIYAARAGLKTLVLENPLSLSQASYAYYVENYPGFPDGVSGRELMDRLKNQAVKFSTELKSEAANSIETHKESGARQWKVETDNNKWISLALIIASGAEAKKLDVVGEAELHGKGVSYCATCDGALFKDKEVVVVGGGDTAVEEALFLTKFANKVTLLHRKSRLRAIKILQDKLSSNKRIRFALNSVVDSILGKEKVKAVRFKNVETGNFGELRCDGVFITIGYIPNTNFVKSILKLDKQGRIITDNSMATSQKGVYACGDCRDTHLQQIVTACGDGALAAVSCQKYIEDLKDYTYE